MQKTEGKIEMNQIIVAPSDTADEMRPEYDFANGVRGKHHAAYRAGTNLVRLDPDVAQRFASSEAVNDALRKLLASETEAAPSPTGQVC